MRKLLVVLSLLIISTMSAHAAKDDTIDLGKLTITPLRSDENISYIPESIAIIDKEAIESMPSTGIVDILNYQAGLTTRDYYGNGTKASVDIRGFGETAGMNTLVLVDGRRTNEVDLSGADWTQIPLDRIERIEVIKGPASTLYGDNAMGGVINIITKKGTTLKPQTTLQAEAGSYGMNKEKILIEGLFKKASYSVNHTHYTTNGYRQNSAFASDDAGSKITYDINDKLSYTFNSNYHKAEYGLPGALRQSQLQTVSRKQSMFPNDRVKEEDWYVDNGLRTQLFGFGVLDTNISLRKKDVDDLLESSKHIDNKKLDTLGICSKYTFDKEIFHQLNKFILGFDFYKTDTSEDDSSFFGLNYYSGDSNIRTTDIDKSSQGYFVQDEIKLFKKLTLSGGYRYEKALYTFNSWPHEGPWTSDLFWMPSLVESKLKVDEDAANVGVNYALSDSAWIFANCSKSFRFPATDEYYSIFATPPVNMSLLPQKAKSYEVGARFDLWSKITMSVTGFLMNIQNELFYNPLTFSNQNYSKTKHQGVEFDAHVKLTKILNLSTYYTYTDAIFKDGLFQGNQIPAVPHHKASLGIEAFLPKGFKAGLFGNYVGARYFISDPAHNYPKMKEYFTLDSKLTYTYKKAEIFFGVNNLLNEKYSEYGVISLMSAEPGFYPSPERNYVAGVTLKF